MAKKNKSELTSKAWKQKLNNLKTSINTTESYDDIKNNQNKIDKRLQYLFYREGLCSEDGE